MHPLKILEYYNTTWHRLLSLTQKVQDLEMCCCQAPMSGGLDVLQMKEEDVLRFLVAGTHLAGTNLDFQMDQYVCKRKSDGIYIINLKKTEYILNLTVQNISGVCLFSVWFVITYTNHSQTSRPGHLILLKGLFQFCWASSLKWFFFWMSVSSMRERILIHSPYKIIIFSNSLTK